MSVVKDDAGIILKKYLVQHGIKQSFVAGNMGISESNFSARMNGRLKFTADFAVSVARVLNISPNIFLK